MFVFSGYKRSDGETDFIVIHKQVGIILIEVKATPNAKSVPSTAKKQLKADEYFISALMSINIPVFKVIAMPTPPRCFNTINM